jgi:hypothetical protein
LTVAVVCDDGIVASVTSPPVPADFGPVDRVLERSARTLAGSALRPDEPLDDIACGNLIRYRENGVDQPVITPKRWARMFSVSRGLTIVTYTRVQLLFLGDGFAVNCPLVSVHRAEIGEAGGVVFAFLRREIPLSLIELRIGARSREFADRLLAARDQEREKLPAASRAAFVDADAPVNSATLGQLWEMRPLRFLD